MLVIAQAKQLTYSHRRSADPAIDSLIPSDAVIEVLANGFDWAEGPVWIEDGEYLLFSDIPPNRIYRWKEGEGHDVWLEPSVVWTLL